MSRPDAYLAKDEAVEGLQLEQDDFGQTCIEFESLQTELCPLRDDLQRLSPLLEATQGMLTEECSALSFEGDFREFGDGARPDRRSDLD